MLVSINYGWKTLVGDLSGAEVEVLARIASKLTLVESKYHDGENRYVAIPGANWEGFQLMVLQPKVKILTPDEFEAMETAKAARDAEKE